MEHIRSATFLTFIVLLCMLFFACTHTGLTGSRIPIDIPENITNSLRQRIENLYSYDALKRGRAAYELGQLGSRAAPAIPYLMDILHDDARLEWRYSITGLDDQRSPTTPGMEAAKALGAIGDAAVEPLIAALNHRERRVRMRAAETLAVTGDVRAVEPLIAVLKHRDPRERMRAASALGAIGDVRAIDPLIAALEVVPPVYQKDPLVAKKAAEALGAIGDPRAVDPLIAALEKRDFWSRVRGQNTIREGAASALGVIGDARAVEPLIAALENEEVKVRFRAARGLQDITRQDFGQEHKKWQQWWEENKDEMLKDK